MFALRISKLGVLNFIFYLLDIVKNNAALGRTEDQKERKGKIEEKEFSA